MSFANLKDELKIGIESLDQEHRVLIGIMEELSNAFDSGVPALDVSDLFGELYDKASAHFALEERLMREKKYPLYKTHKADHRRLLDRVRDMMDAYEDGVCTKCDVNFSTCIESWFVTHVTEEDTGLRDLDKTSHRPSFLDQIKAFRS
jgi:hemerythrin-like metal-binding protein